MKQCKCGSYALNLHKEGIDQGSLCDRHYWQDRAEKAEKDAARYRWLRDGHKTVRFGDILMLGMNADDEIDAAIAKDAP